MQDFEELKKAKQRCVDELVEALPRYRERLDEIDHRLVEYIEDALSNNASHCNIYVLSPPPIGGTAIKQGEKETNTNYTN